MGLIPPRLWSMLAWERYTRHLPPSCCGVVGCEEIFVPPRRKIQKCNSPYRKYEDHGSDSAPTLVDVGLEKVYKAPAPKLLRWYRCPAFQSPQPVQAPSYVLPPVEIRKLITQNKHI